MDPDTALNLIRETACTILTTLDQSPSDLSQDMCRQLAETALALDEWLTRGGFLPRVWQPS